MPTRNTLKALFLFLTLVPVAALYALVPAGSPPPTTADEIVIHKGAHQLLLLRNGTVLRAYRVSLGREPRGPKSRAGDHRTPEGSDRVDWRNPQSKFHRSLHVSYPNVQDLQTAQRASVQPGGDIMIHGLQNGLGWIGRFHRFVDWTDGCIAVTNSEMDQIWRAVPDKTPIEIRP